MLEPGCRRILFLGLILCNMLYDGLLRLELTDDLTLITKGRNKEVLRRNCNLDQLSRRMQDNELTLAAKKIWR